MTNQKEKEKKTLHMRADSAGSGFSSQNLKKNQLYPFSGV